MATLTYTTRRILLASRPAGAPSAESFRFEDVPAPKPSEGEILLKILYLSLDPYMRGRLSAAKSFARPVGVGAVMEGGTVAEVVLSRHSDFSEGDNRGRSGRPRL